MVHEEFKDYIANGHKTHLPHVSIDCAVFGFHEGQLKVLLLKWKYLDGWSLPGGHIQLTEDANTAANRLLKERTGLDNVFLQQYHTFTSIDRNTSRGLRSEEFEKAFGFEWTGKSWLSERFVSIGYYALVEFSKVDPKPDSFTEECEWCDIHKLPHLLFDHKEMVSEALRALRTQISHQPIGLNLLPKEFTMMELQLIYETILETKLDRANFRKKLLGLGILKKTGERPTGKAHKTPHLYSFDKRQYAKALKDGISFSI